MFNHYKMIMIHFFFNLLFSYYRNHTQYISSFLSISPGEMNTVKDQPNSKDVRIFAAKARDGTKNTLHVRHTPFCDGSHYLSIMQMAEQEIVMQLFFFVFRMLQTWPLITHTGLQKRADQDMLLQTARASWRIKKSLQVLCSMLRRLWQTNTLRIFILTHSFMFMYAGIVAGGVIGVTVAAALAAVFIYKWQKKDRGYILGQ